MAGKDVEMPATYYEDNEPVATKDEKKDWRSRETDLGLLFDTSGSALSKPTRRDATISSVVP